jgi:hypothetical protein
MICEVPGCRHEVANKKRGLCARCASSLYYWNRRKKESRTAVNHRRNQLEFWNSRFDWFFAPGNARTRGPISQRQES